MLTFAAISVISLAVGVLLHWKKVGKRTVPWFLLIASFGVAGLLGTVLDRIVTSLTAGTTSASGRLFGTAVPVLLAVVASVYLAIHMRPKGQPPTRFTPWIALAYAPILYAAGGVFASAAGLGENFMAEFATGATAAVAEFVASLR